MAASGSSRLGPTALTTRPQLTNHLRPHPVEQLHQAVRFSDARARRRSGRAVPRGKQLSGTVRTHRTDHGIALGFFVRDSVGTVCPSMPERPTTSISFTSALRCAARSGIARSFSTTTVSQFVFRFAAGGGRSLGGTCSSGMRTPGSDICSKGIFQQQFPDAVRWSENIDSFGEENSLPPRIVRMFSMRVGRDVDPASLRSQSIYPPQRARVPVPRISDIPTCRRRRAKSIPDEPEDDQLELGVLLPFFFSWPKQPVRVRPVPCSSPVPDHRGRYSLLWRDLPLERSQASSSSPAVDRKEQAFFPAPAAQRAVCCKRRIRIPDGNITSACAKPDRIFHAADTQT